MLPCLLRRWFARFKLCAHPLEARGKRFNSLLLLSRTRFQCLNFAMLFEKLVEQHRVHLVVAHAVGFPSLSRTTRSGFTFSTSSATSPNCDVPVASISFL